MRCPRTHTGHSCLAMGQWLEAAKGTLHSYAVGLKRAVSQGNMSQACPSGRTPRAWPALRACPICATGHPKSSPQGTPALCNPRHQPPSHYKHARSKSAKSPHGSTYIARTPTAGWGSSLPGVPTLMANVSAPNRTRTRTEMSKREGRRGTSRFLSLNSAMLSWTPGCRGTPPPCRRKMKPCQHKHTAIRQHLFNTGRKREKIHFSK